MTDRICPKCTSAICIPVVDPERSPTGWLCTECGLEWIELDAPSKASLMHTAARLPSLDPIRGGRVE
jgi:hypothetical protein